MIQALELVKMRFERKIEKQKRTHDMIVAFVLPKTE
jgi:hypothetical protein